MCIRDSKYGVPLIVDEAHGAHFHFSNYFPTSAAELGAEDVYKRQVEDTEEYLNKPIQVQVLDVDKESKKLILSAKEILRAKAEEERKNKVSNLEIGLVTEGTVESLSLIHI